MPFRGLCWGGESRGAREASTRRSAYPRGDTMRATRSSFARPLRRWLRDGSAERRRRGCRGHRARRPDHVRGRKLPHRTAGRLLPGRVEGRARRGQLRGQPKDGTLAGLAEARSLPGTPEHGVVGPSIAWSEGDGTVVSDEHNADLRGADRGEAALANRDPPHRDRQGEARRRVTPSVRPGEHFIARPASCNVAPANPLSCGRCTEWRWRKRPMHQHVRVVQSAAI